MRDMHDQTIQWRETQRPVRFLCFDARIVIFIGLALAHVRVWTICVLVFAAVALLIMERKGMRPENAGRHFRTWLSGPVIRARRLEDLRMPAGFSDGTPE